MPGKIISLVNFKGGVGKTTLTVNLAACLAKEHDKKVLIVDLDPQSNSSIWLMGPALWSELNSEDLFKKTTAAMFLRDWQERAEHVLHRPCASLPDKGLSQALAKGTTKDSYLTAFLVCHYWKARPGPQHGLEIAAREIESDYNNSPAAKQTELAKALFRNLLGESDFNQVVAILQGKYPDKEALGTFAKAVGLKVPPARNRFMNDWQPRS